MNSHFAQQWSTALGLNVSSVPADNEGIQRLSQGMADFLQMRTASSVMDKINLELNSLAHVSDDIRLKLDFGNGMVVNEDTRQLADAFLVEAKEAVQGKWPGAWGDDLKEPLLVFVAYAVAHNALAKNDSIDWQKTLPVLSATYVREKGTDKLREHINSIDQLLPQVLTGVASAVLDENGMALFSQKMKTFAAQRSGSGVKPQPLEFLDILLEARGPQSHSDAPGPVHP